MNCAHTEDGHGFYVKRVERYRQYYDANGNATGTDDGRAYRLPSGGNIAYCENCGKRLGRIIVNPFSHNMKIIP
jgi:hypothetical protein